MVLLLYPFLNTVGQINRRKRVIPAVCILNSRVCISVSLLLLEAVLNCRLQCDVAQRQPASLLNTVILLQQSVNLFKPPQSRGSLQEAKVIISTLSIWQRCGLWAGGRDTGREELQNMVVEDEETATKNKSSVS